VVCSSNMAITGLRGGCRMPVVLPGVKRRTGRLGRRSLQARQDTLRWRRPAANRRTRSRGRYRPGKAIDIAFSRPGMTTSTVPAGRRVQPSRPTTGWVPHSGSAPCTRQDFLLRYRGTEFVDENLVRRFEFFHELAAKELQPCGLLFAHQPYAALPFVDEGMIHEAELFSWIMLLLAGGAFQPRIDVIDLAQTVERVINGRGSGSA